MAHDYQVVTPAKVEEVKMDSEEVKTEEAKVTDMEVDETNGKGSGKGSGSGDKKVVGGGKSYPCAECGVVYHHREMILSRRAKHGKLVEVPPKKLPDSDSKEEVYVPKEEIRYLKICAKCELQERRAAGQDVTLMDVKTDIHRPNRSKEWNARGMFYFQACQDVDTTGLSRSEASKKKTERCRELAAEFLSLLQQEDLFGVFSGAGQRMQEAMKQRNIMDNLAVQLDHASSQRDA